MIGNSVLQLSAPALDLIASAWRRIEPLLPEKQSLNGRGHVAFATRCEQRRLQQRQLLDHVLHGFLLRGDGMGRPYDADVAIVSPTIERFRSQL